MLSRTALKVCCGGLKSSRRSDTVLAVGFAEASPQLRRTNDIQIWFKEDWSLPS